MLLLRNGRTVPVRSVRSAPYFDDVYNFQVDELECYAVGWNGVLVHNVNGAETKAASTADGMEGVGDATFASSVEDARATLSPAKPLPEELRDFRQTLPPKTPTSGGTVGVASTDLPALDLRPFKGASPNANGPVGGGGSIKSPNPSKRFQLHAEEDLANQIDGAIQGVELTSEEMVGRTVNMHIEQRVCNICRQGLGGTEVPPGVLKQLSDKYPNITFRVTAEGTNEVLRFRGGKFLD
jgi:hypothetical protein